MQWEVTLQQNKLLLGYLWPGIGLRHARAQALHTQPSPWNPEIGVHKQCINMTETSNTSTACWQECEVDGFAALLSYPGCICLKRNGVIIECWGWRAFSQEQMTADNSSVWAFLLDPGTFWSWLYPNPHSTGVLELCPIQKCLSLILGYFTDRQRMCYTKGVPYKGCLSLQ